jgi:hypothetical protein
MFRGMFQVISYGYWKNRSECCTCCNGCTHILQVSVSNMSSIFSDVYCKCVYLDVIYVSHICCKCFIWMLRMFAMVFNCFCKCFTWMFQVFYLSFFYVASIAFECFKSVSDAAYVMRMGSRRVRERSPVQAPFRRRGWRRHGRATSGQREPTCGRARNGGGTDCSNWRGRPGTGSALFSRKTFGLAPRLGL